MKFVGFCKTVLQKVGLDNFVLALLGMIFLAWLWPAGGVRHAWFSLADIANVGVSVIFFFYGLRLDPEKLKAGLSNWRLHVVVQLFTFIMFPLLILAIKSIFDSANTDPLWLGVFYLAALPSTVSSSVVMVSIAGGNIPSAIFNASISSLIGVFVTPLWMGLFLQSSGTGFDLGPIILKLILQVLVPVMMGILLHKKLLKFSEKYRDRMKAFDQIVILMIVYTSFCDSFEKRMFSGYSFVSLFGLGISMILMFLMILLIIQYLSKMLHFNREDKITAVFCGSKKSLVHGTVMSKVLFTGSISVGVVLLPVMMYHALQLVAASIIAKRWQRELILKK